MEKYDENKLENPQEKKNWKDFPNLKKLEELLKEEEELKNQIEELSKETIYSLSFLKEEIMFSSENKEYKALCDKENKLKAQIKNFDELFDLRKEVSKYDKKTKLWQNMQKAIARRLATLPNCPQFIKRLNIRVTRLELHRKLKLMAEKK